MPPLNLTVDLEKTIGHFFCATSGFVHHFIAISGFRLRVTVWKCPNRGKICFDLWLWPLTSNLTFCMDITFVNSNYSWKFHDHTTLPKRYDRQRDRQNHSKSCLVTAENTTFYMPGVFRWDVVWYGAVWFNHFGYVAWEWWEFMWSNQWNWYSSRLNASILVWHTCASALSGWVSYRQLELPKLTLPDLHHVVG